MHEQMISGWWMDEKRRLKVGGVLRVKSEERVNLQQKHGRTTK